MFFSTISAIMTEENAIGFPNLPTMLPSSNLQRNFVFPKIFPGRLCAENKGAMDWGVQNLFAFGCHSYVCIIDAFSYNIVQALDEHRAPVVLVKWSVLLLLFVCL